MGVIQQTISRKFSNTVRHLYLYKALFNITTVVFTNSSAVKQYCKKYEVHTLPVVETNKYGLPKIKHLLLKARESYPASQYLYINSDILINPFIFRIAELLDGFFDHNSNVGFVVPLSCSTYSHQVCIPHHLFQLSTFHH